LGSKRFVRLQRRPSKLPPKPFSALFEELSPYSGIFCI